MVFCKLEYNNQEKTKLKDISNTSPNLELLKKFEKDTKKMLINKKEETADLTLGKGRCYHI